MHGTEVTTSYLLMTSASICSPNLCFLAINSIYQAVYYISTLLGILHVPQTQMSQNRSKFSLKTLPPPSSPPPPPLPPAPLFFIQINDYTILLPEI